MKKIIKYAAVCFMFLAAILADERETTAIYAVGGYILLFMRSDNL